MKSHKFRVIDEMARQNRAERKIDWTFVAVWTGALLFCITVWAILIQALRDAVASLPWG